MADFTYVYICDVAEIGGAYGLRGWPSCALAASAYFGSSVVGGPGVSGGYLTEYSYSMVEMGIFSARWFHVGAPGAAS